MNNLKKACEMALNEEMEKMDKAYAVSLIDGHIDRPTHTDNEIIKALECCISSGDCKGCPSYIEKDDDCLGIKWSSILDLINRQQAEIEELKTAMNCYRSYEEEQIAIAIKEFAERLKPLYKELCVDAGDWYNELDNLVKEMVGED